MRGIDLSAANGTVDFDAAQRAGLQFAILKLGYGQDDTTQDDGMFERAVAACEARGIPWGAYLYSYALTADRAHGEADHAKRMLAGKKPSYPVFIDMEDADGYKARHGGIQDAQVYTDIIKNFCEDMIAAGYRAGWYANANWHDHHVHADQLKAYDFWFARPAATPEDYGQVIVQDQIGSTGGTFPGVTGLCDTDVCDVDLPSLIKAAGKNGWAAEQSGTAQDATPTAPTVDVPDYPLPSGYYFGPRSGPVCSVSGYYNYRDDLRRWQQQMADRGWDIAADGLYGDETASVTQKFQSEKGLTVDGLIGPQTWAAAWTEPIT